MKIQNIGPELKEKLEKVGIYSKGDLQIIGSKEALIRISELENSGVCINMLYALEGAIRGIRWHNLEKTDKQDLLQFYNSIWK